MTGRPIIDVRARYEDVDDASKPLAGQATTLRARLGYETGSWHGLRFAFAIDQIWAIGATTYNSTRNGKASYAVIADPAMTALDRLTLTYDTGFDTTITVGRQRLVLGNQRFIGDSGWRQHEQTFDAVTVESKPLDGVALTYAYLYRINRVFGPGLPNPDTTAPAAAAQANYFKSNSHIFDAVYTGVANLRLEGYSFLLDLSAPGFATSAAQRTAVAKLSTATFGGRADYSTPLAAGVSAKLSAEYAHQTDYAGNPLHYGLDYWLAEGNLNFETFGAGAGYEVLGGNGTIGFSTPLATLHAFNGWADLFLATPVNGLKDAYFKISDVVPLAGLDLKSLTGTVVYHDYATDKLDGGIGSEWDAALNLAVDVHTSVLLQYADYQGSGITYGGFPDKSLFWVQAVYIY